METVPSKPKVSAADRLFGKQRETVIKALRTMNPDQLRDLATSLHAQLPRTARDLKDHLNSTKQWLVDGDDAPPKRDLLGQTRAFNDRDGDSRDILVR